MFAVMLSRDGESVVRLPFGGEPRQVVEIAEIYASAYGEVLLSVHKTEATARAVAESKPTSQLPDHIWRLVVSESHEDRSIAADWLAQRRQGFQPLAGQSSSDAARRSPGLRPGLFAFLDLQKRNASVVTEAPCRPSIPSPLPTLLARVASVKNSPPEPHARAARRSYAALV
jgi:hypothetical protein